MCEMFLEVTIGFVPWPERPAAIKLFEVVLLFGLAAVVW